MISGPEDRPRVVVADDHPSVRLALGRVLQASCEVVANVSNGSEAVDAVIRLRPDILIVDLMMPDVDGLEVCRSVKQVVPETAIVIITAFDDVEVQKIALQDGAAAFVPKHQAAETLVATVQQVFAAKRPRSAPVE